LPALDPDAPSGFERRAEGIRGELNARCVRTVLGFGNDQAARDQLQRLVLVKDAGFDRAVVLGAAPRRGRPPTISMHETRGTSGSPVNVECRIRAGIGGPAERRVYCDVVSISKALTIAGSDSGGGAGIQADLKTFSAFQVFGMSVITAVTAQNSVGVHAVETLPPAVVVAQLEAVLGDFGADAAKIGMLSTAPIVRAVAERLGRSRLERLVVDPVMIAKSGDPLLQPDARDALAGEILPLAFVVTPNLHEAAALAGMPVETPAEMEEAARRIFARGARHVLVKGGHLKDDATDILWDGRTLVRFTAPRVESTATHGTGCTFSAAIAAGLARGRALDEAVREAKAYVTRAIRDGFHPGRGVGTPRHFITEW
jgi:hydroxymethylpyrimidine/phosphomethylpyrimidine kinase